MRRTRLGVAALAATAVVVFVPGRGSAAPPPEDFTRGTAVIALHVQGHLPLGLGGELPPGLGGPLPAQAHTP